MTEELKTPIRFKCPNCGYKETILNNLAQKEIAAGLLPKDDFIATRVMPIFLADSIPLQSGAMAGKKVRQVLRYYDQCARCGTDYCYLVRVVEFEVPPLPGKNKPIIYTPGPGHTPPSDPSRN